MRALFRRWVLAVALVLFASVAGPSEPKPKTHVIAVKFRYDFSRDPACPAGDGKRCVKQFNVYKLTGKKKPELLFSITAPKGARDKSRRMAGKSKPLVLDPGKHRIGVSAVNDLGKESDPQACSTMIEVPPK